MKAENAFAAAAATAAAGAGSLDFAARMTAARTGAFWLGGSGAIVCPPLVTPIQLQPISQLLKFEPLALSATVDDRPPEIDAVVEACKSQLNAISSDQTAAIAAATASTGGANQAFIDQMNALKAQTAAKVTATINQTYDQLTAIGNSNPQSQSLILQATAEIATLANAAQSAIANGFDGAISAAKSAMNAVASAAEAAAEAAQAAAEAAAEAVASAASTVASGVESIFSGW